MRAIAIMEAERPGLDSVILWDDGDRLVAFAYLDGKVKMTRPLEASNVRGATREVCRQFQIAEAQLTRVNDWQGKPTEQVANLPRRWT